MEQHKDEFSATNLQIVAIAQAHPRHAYRFCSKLAPSVTCLCNSTLDDYHAYGISEGAFSRWAGPKTAPAYWRAFRAGHTIGRLAPGENIRLMPATFLVDIEGYVIHAHYNETVADYPDLSTLVQIIKDTRQEE